MEGFVAKNYNISRLISRLKSWPEAIRYYEDEKISGLKDGTIDKNLCDIISFLSYQNRPLDRICPEDVRGWLMWTKGSHIRETTLARRFTTVKRFLLHAGRPDLANSIPKMKEHYKTNSRVLTNDEIMAVFKCCRNEHERALIILLWSTGCRVSEILSVRKKDIHLDDLGIYVVVDGKTGQRPVRLVHSSAVGIIKKLYSKMANYDDLLFEGKTYNWAYWIFRRLRTEYGIDVHPHMFRHTKATEMLTRYTEAVVKKYLGWSKDSRMPLHYEHISDRQLDMILLEENK